MGENIESRLRSMNLNAGRPSWILADNNFVVSREEYEVWNLRILSIDGDFHSECGRHLPLYVCSKFFWVLIRFHIFKGIGFRIYQDPLGAFSASGDRDMI